MEKMILSLLVLLPICVSSAPLTSNIFSSEDTDVCNPNTFDEIKDCPDGKLMFFQLKSLGELNLPLLAVAGYCDVSKPVFLGDLGVVCTKTPLRRFFNPTVEKLANQWKEEFHKIRLGGSGWKQVNEQLWIRVVSPADEKLPERPFTVKYEIMNMEPDGSFKDENLEEGSFFIDKDTNNVFGTYPVGTVLECFRYFTNEPSKSQRYSFSVTGIIPFRDKGKSKK